MAVQVLDLVISFFIILLFGLFVWSRLVKKPMGELINDIFKEKIYLEPVAKPLEASKQIWMKKQNRI